MNQEFFEALKLLEQEKQINLKELVEKIKNAIAVAIKKDYGNLSDVSIELDLEKNIFSVFITKNVVEKVEDNINEICIEEAKKYDTNARVGYPVMIKLNTKKFGRIAALSAKHVIKQGIRDGEKNRVYDNLKNKENMVVSAIVSKVDPQKNNVSLIIDSSEVMLPRSEQIPGEVFVEGDVIKVYVTEVSKTERGPKILISRTHPDLVRKLFEIEIPEIKNGIIEIKSIAREEGSRTKVSVFSNNPDIDPVGSCVGAKGIRVNKIVNELRGEKIDIIKYSEDFVEYISNALAPASIECVIADPSCEKTCVVIVADNQLSLAIGNRGQNVRLSAKLTGWKIDIKPEKMLDQIRDEIEKKQIEIDNQNHNFKSDLLENTEDTTNNLKDSDQEERIDDDLIFNFDKETNDI